MGYTLAEARSRVLLDYLDDPDGDRWSNAEIDRHLEFAHEQVIRTYTGEGGMQFRTETITNAVGGEIDLSAARNVRVRDVFIVRGNYLEPVEFVDYRNIGLSYTGAETFKVIYDEVPAFPTVDGDALVDDVNTFKALEELIVLRAVEYAAIKDREAPLSVERVMQRLYSDVMSDTGQRKAGRFQKPSGSSGLCWSYRHDDNKVVLSYKDET